MIADTSVFAARSTGEFDRLPRPVCPDPGAGGVVVAGVGVGLSPDCVVPVAVPDEVAVPDTDDVVDVDVVVTGVSAGASAIVVEPDEVPPELAGTASEPTTWL